MSRIGLDVLRWLSGAMYSFAVVPQGSVPEMTPRWRTSFAVLVYPGVVAVVGANVGLSASVVGPD